MKRPVRANGDASDDAFQLEDFLPHRLSVAAETVSRLINRQYLARSGLSMPEWRLLAAVGRTGVLSPTVAGEQTSMDKVKVSRAAASLVSRGLLRQGPDPNDGRGRLLRLTRKGVTLYNGVAPTAREIEDTLSAGLSKAEAGTLQKALLKLSEHAQSLMEGESGEEA